MRVDAAGIHWKSGAGKENLTGLVEEPAPSQSTHYPVGGHHPALVVRTA